MRTITARNVNTALIEALAILSVHGVREDSRNGPVIRAPWPVTTVLQRPTERVLFAPWRDANPFFHIVEAAWILSGRDDLKALTPYVKGMARFSDDGGKTQPAAYGKRMRGWGGGPDEYRYEWPDQLNWAVKRLIANPQDRRVVIQMWDPSTDIVAADLNGNDVPCNLLLLPWVSGGMLHLTIINRSNDIIWGLYGANAVHFSVLLEYLAWRIGLPVGTMTTVSNNFHMYEATAPTNLQLAQGDAFPDPYSHAYFPTAKPFALDTDWTTRQNRMPQEKREKIIQEDLLIFFDHSPFEAATKARWLWMRRVLVPMALAHAHYKKTRGADRYVGATKILQRVEASDWRLAAQQWVERRRAKWEARGDAGVAGVEEDA